MSPPTTTSQAFNARKVAFDGLYMLLKPGSGNRVGLDDWLSSLFEHHRLSGAERGTATHLTYTLCRFWFALDPHIAKLSSVPLKKLETRVLILLKLGLIQLTEEVDSPDYAAIDETMKLAKRMKLAPRAQGFIHAILRRAASAGPVVLDPDCVFPDWLKTQWQHAYGQEWLKTTQDAFCEKPNSISVRLNPLVALESPITLTTAQDLDGFCPPATSFLSPLRQNKLWGQVQHVSRIQELEGLSEGALIPQDAAAFAVSLALAPQPGERVLEIGAAPEGKRHIWRLL